MFSFPFLTTLTRYLKVTVLDEPFDVLNCFVTTFIFISSAILVSANAYVGTAVECWLPKYFSNQWEQFAESYCFMKDMYFFPDDEKSFDDYDKEANRIEYYQWTGMYLTIAGVFFMAPKIFWRVAQKITALPTLHIFTAVEHIQKETTENRKERIADLAELLRDKIVFENQPKLFRVRLMTIYLLAKCLYSITILLEFCVMTIFVGQKNDLLWGWKLALNLYHGVTWETTGVFPRMTYCDFTVRQMTGNNYAETIQCFIGVNEFNEKIFLFLWFWLVFTFLMSLIGIFHAFYKLRGTILVEQLLFGAYDLKNHLEVTDFAENYLTRDGQLLMNFVKAQSDAVAFEITKKMWEDFKELKEQVED